MSGQEKEASAGLPADLHDLASASLSNQVQIMDGDAAAVRSANPLSELQADEEFVIKNYRLIKKKKGGLGPIHDRRMAHVKEPAFAQGTDPANLPGSPLSPKYRGAGSPGVSSQRLEEGRLGGDGSGLREAELATESWFQSKIRVSNSIISPHTYKFSTHIGPTTSMKWELVA
jgi:hypothetical protein